MAIFLNGLSSKEIVHLTQAMATTGSLMEWPEEWKDTLVDKHSTGGVGDKISLLLAPALAALGLKVPMISGRGLGFTGGTLDKLESIPGFRVSLSSSEMSNCLEKAGCFIAGQTDGFVPADRRLYALRDVTATVDSLGLITASIISKKAAENIRALVLDVKVGTGSYQKSLADAKVLSKSLVSTAANLKISTTAIISNMDAPLGKTIGNSLEVREAVKILRREEHNNDIYELVTTLGGILLLSMNKVKTIDEGIASLGETLKDGRALLKFEDMIKHQGVEEKTARELCHGCIDLVLPRAEHVTAVEAQSSDPIQISRPNLVCPEGYICGLDSLLIAKACGNLGASRFRAGDKLDLSAGFHLLKHVGDYVSKGEPWGEIHHNCSLSKDISQLLAESISISDERQFVSKRVLEIIHS
ncbi:hypothetical protein QYM36_011788 [Artemia franciscana]|uniref:Thymidine phosphorylase n=1 Tax=Artemia franciscana TaxID=6661 RepID=A0AA88HMW1_ARTSF|nr:hypothetical protein QYM36_011788 [Artemia franciscana]